MAGQHQKRTREAADALRRDILAYALGFAARQGGPPTGAEIGAHFGLTLREAKRYRHGLAGRPDWPKETRPGSRNESRPTGDPFVNKARAVQALIRAVRAKQG